VVGATATVMVGDGALMAALAVAAAKGPFTAPPWITANDSAGAVKVPVVPGKPVAITFNSIVQKNPDAIVGVASAVKVICEGTLESTADGQVLLTGLESVSSKPTNGKGTLVERLEKNGAEVAKFLTIMVSTAFDPDATVAGAKLGLTPICACTCVDEKSINIAATQPEQNTYPHRANPHLRASIQKTTNKIFFNMAATPNFATFICDLIFPSA
jgi:hypothetical protein